MDSEILYWVGHSLGNLLDGRNLVQAHRYVMDSSQSYSESRHEQDKSVSPVVRFDLTLLAS
jgi:hypothetical protein